ncbi:MAG: hypothetical protein ACJ735_03620 [Actinomycetes bacterium]
MRTGLFDEACAAIDEVGPRVADLIRTNRGLTRPAIGNWGLADLAAHLSHVMKVDADSVSGRPVPDVTPPLSAARVTALTTLMMAADSERDPRVLADRIAATGAAFTKVEPSAETVTWLAGMQLPPSAVACHLLEELLVHGFDIAQAARAPWPIHPAHAALVIAGAVVPILSADPMTFLDPEQARGFRARIDIRLRGFERYGFLFDDGLVIESGPTAAADVHLSIQPDQMLLVTLGRMAAWRPFVAGKAFVWGRRPDHLLKMMRVVVGP